MTPIQQWERAEMERNVIYINNEESALHPYNMHFFIFLLFFPFVSSIKFPTKRFQVEDATITTATMTATKW